MTLFWGDVHVAFDVCTTTVSLTPLSLSPKPDHNLAQTGWFQFMVSRAHRSDAGFQVGFGCKKSSKKCASTNFARRLVAV